MPLPFITVVSQGLPFCFVFSPPFASTSVCPLPPYNLFCKFMRQRTCVLIFLNYTMPLSWVLCTQEMLGQCRHSSSFILKAYMFVLSRFSRVQLFGTPWAVACQLSLGFSRQEYWSELLYPPPENLPNSGIEPMSLTSNLHWQVDSLPVAPPGKPSKPAHTWFFWNRCWRPSRSLLSSVPCVPWSDQGFLPLQFFHLECSWLTSQALKGRYQQVTLKMSFRLAYSLWEFAVWLRKLKQGLCINLGGGMGREMGGRLRREGMYVYLWLIHVEVWQKTTKFCKAIILQLKKKN